MGGQKASKSAGVGTTVPQLLAAFDPDAIRYYLIANGPESADTNFTEEDFVRRNNDELVAAWGNLVHRTLTFIQRYFDGRVPDAQPEAELLATIDSALERVAQSLDAVRLKEGLREAMAVAQAGNRYFDERAPWVQVKQDMPGGSDHRCHAAERPGRHQGAVQPVRTVQLREAPRIAGLGGHACRPGLASSSTAGRAGVAQTHTAVRQARGTR